MGLFEGLQSLLGGGQGGQGAQQQQRREYQDFVGRYEQGAPWDGISDQEAAQRYQQVAPRLSPQEYQESAQEAFARLSAQERLQLGQHLRQRARQQGVDVPDLNRDGIDDRLQDPAYLAHVTSRMHQQQPGLLGQLLGGAAGGSPGGAPDRAVLEAIQIRDAYEADKHTPTDQWLRARGMTQAQLDAALALAARADPRGTGRGAGAGAAGVVDNPLAKAALAGIAAVAVKRMMGGR